MLYWTIILFIVFVTYTTFIVVRYGLLHSISMSYYKLREDDLGMLFYVFCFALALPLFSIFAATQQTVWVVASFGFMLVGSASKFFDKHTDLAHYIGAGLGIVMCFIGLYLSWGQVIPSIIMVVAGAVCLKSTRPIWWIEIAAFVIIITGLTVASL